MIAFQIWLPQILGYCDFLCDDLALRRAWVNHDMAKTSVTGFEELYEQILRKKRGQIYFSELVGWR